MRAALAAGIAEGFVPLPWAVPRGERHGDTTLAERVHALAAADAAEPVPAPERHHLYPRLSVRVDDLAVLRHRHGGLDRDVRTAESATVAGRIRAYRTFGSLAFATLRCGAAQIQVIVEAATVGDEALAAWKTAVRPNDLVIVTGEIVTSRSGELSVLADHWTIAATSVGPTGGDVLGDAADRMLAAEGYARVPLPPWHPALPGGLGPAPDGAVERVFHLGREGSPMLHVRESLADAAALRDLVYRLPRRCPR